MWGQWFGKISGDNNVRITLNIDGDSPYYGKFMVFDQADGNSHIWNIIFSENNDGKKVTAALTNLTHTNYDNNISRPTTEKFPAEATLEGEIEKYTITGELNPNKEVNYTFKLLKSDVLSDVLKSDSVFGLEDLTPTEADHTFRWEEFKEWALKPEHQTKRTIFRGHSNNRYRLLSTFYRTNRRDLLRYITEDVPELKKYISATVGKSFDLRNPEDYGSLLHLAQHHGYPTPLLDWTESPFVAAYFAFNKIPKKPGSLGSNDYIRIFALDRESWNSKYPPAHDIDTPRPSFSVLDLPFRDNPRAVPQQSVQTFSNLYHTETLIDALQESDGCQYLTKIDIATSERDKVMSELNLMNITASSLFPGLDGMCQTLKEKYF